MFEIGKDCLPGERPAFEIVPQQSGGQGQNQQSEPVVAAVLFPFRQFTLQIAMVHRVEKRNDLQWGFGQSQNADFVSHVPNDRRRLFAVTHGFLRLALAFAAGGEVCFRLARACIGSNLLAASLITFIVGSEGWRDLGVNRLNRTCRLFQLFEFLPGCCQAGIEAERLAIVLCGRSNLLTGLVGRAELVVVARRGLHPHQAFTVLRGGREAIELRGGQAGFEVAFAEMPVGERVVGRRQERAQTRLIGERWIQHDHLFEMRHGRIQARLLIELATQGIFDAGGVGVQHQRLAQQLETIIRVSGFERFLIEALRALLIFALRLQAGAGEEKEPYQQSQRCI
ncbi:hypothetical protein HUU39_17210 [candidate division KSB1 bacterium]|nr:hypothetical protein [candidate division KSB1 bacterium]